MRAPLRRGVPAGARYASAGAAPYFAYPGAVAGRGYYSVRLGSWRLFSLNGKLGPAERAAQLAWLREEVARHPARCTLAYWHHPLYSSGMKGNDERMNDARQAVSGRGRAGAVRPRPSVRALRAAGRRWPARRCARQQQHGVLRLGLGADGYSREFLAATGSGADRGAAKCH